MRFQFATDRQFQVPTILKVAALALLSLLAAANWLPAGDGSVVTLPLPGKKAPSGLRITLDTRWLTGSGHRPVRVTVGMAAALPAPADRRIELTMSFLGQRGGMQTPEVRTFIDLPQGATSITKTVAVPYSDSWYWGSLETREDGRILYDLTQEHLGLANRGSGSTEAVPNILFIHKSARSWKERQANVIVAGTVTQPDIRPVASLLGLLNSYGNSLAISSTEQYNDSEIQNILNNCDRIELLPPSELPEQWIDYSSIDVIVLYHDTLSMLSPAAWDAIRFWARAGGVLCFSGDRDFANYQEIERAMELEPLPLKSSEPGGRSWSAPDLSKTWMENPFTNRVNTGQVFRPGQPALPSLQFTATLPKTLPFIWRSVGYGQLVIFGSDDPAKQSQQVWTCFLSSLPEDNWKWYRRHGASLSRANPDFGNWMIPDVGRAPVFGFLILISMFAIVIGPINYFVLTRRKRTILLLVTVPLSASIVTAGLFLYALIQDGLGTRLRVRNHTIIDQKNGSMVCQSRQTYYAGLSPSGGLVYPGDATVIKVDHFPQRSYSRLPPPFGVTLLDDQVFEKGYIAARTMSQFVVTRSATTTSRLDIGSPSRSDSGSALASLEVENHLGAAVRQLLVRDKSGEYFFGESIPDKGKAVLKQVALADVATKMREVSQRSRPAFPDGFDPNQSSASPWFSSRSFFGNSFDASEPAPSFSTGALERGIGRCLFLDPRTENLLPGSYVAVVDASPDVPVGLASTQEVASLHVIEGTW